MYIELFILDNFVMDALLLRLACALCAASARLSRLMLFSLLGAALAFASLLFAPLATLPGKLICAMLMALALPVGSFGAYLRAFAAVLAAALLVGGLALLFAIADGSGMSGGVLMGQWKLRTALLVAGIAAFAPLLVRHLRMKGQARCAKVLLVFAGKEHRLRGLWDSGARLYEPVSGRPVIAAHLPALAAEAKIPVPASTVSGETMLYALKPDALFIDGRASDALVAPIEAQLRGAEAIIPYRIFGEAR